MSIQRQIFENLHAKLSTITWAKLVEWENIRVLISDFSQHEFPAIQIYDTGEAALNQQRVNEVTLSFSVEIVMTRNTTELVDQALLFDRKLEVKKMIGEDPRLGIVSSPSVGSFRHVQYVGAVTDFHSIAPHYIARLDFQALFLEPFIGEC